MYATIRPSILNILGGGGNFEQHSRQENRVQDDAKKESFWAKAKRFCKKVGEILVCVLPFLPPILNAISRYKAANQSNDNRRSGA